MPETILIAEDQHTILNLIEFKPKNSGYNVIVVEDGLSALEKAKTMRPTPDFKNNSRFLASVRVG